MNVFLIHLKYATFRLDLIIRIKNGDHNMIDPSRKKSWIFLKCIVKSLDDCWLTLFFLFINMACFYKSFLYLNKFNDESWQKLFAQKSYTELYVYIGFLIFNVFLLPFYVWTSLFKIGSYANDGLKYGHDLFCLDDVYEKNVSKQMPSLSDKKFREKSAASFKAQVFYE